MPAVAACTDPPDDRQWVSLRAVARLLRISPKAAGKLAKSGELASRRLPGLPRKFDRDAALKLAAECESKPGRTPRPEHDAETGVNPHV